MSIEFLKIREFSDTLSKYAKYLIDNGVDLSKVRFTDTPNVKYDYEQNLLITNSILFYDGKIIETKKTIMITTEPYDVTNVNLSEVINNTNLGVVLYVEDLVKKYIDGEWVLIFNMAFLDEKVDALNQFDDTFNINEGSLSDKVNDIKSYFESNSELGDLVFCIVPRDLYHIISQQDGFNQETMTFCGLQVKINSNLMSNIMSLSSYDNSFYLKIENE